MSGRRRPGRAAGAILLAGPLWACAAGAGGAGAPASIPASAALVAPAGAAAVAESRPGAGGAPADLERPAGAPLAWSFETLGGRPLSLEALRGRPVLVNLWATWCPPCVRELASLAALAAGLPDGADIPFVLVSPEEPARVRAFIARHLAGAPARVLPVTEATLAPAELGELVLPTTLILDHRGRVVLRHDGAAEWDTPEMRRLLVELAQETRAAEAGGGRP